MLVCMESGGWAVAPISPISRVARERSGVAADGGLAAPSGLRTAPSFLVRPRIAFFVRNRSKYEDGASGASITLRTTATSRENREDGTFRGLSRSDA